MGTSIKVHGTIQPGNATPPPESGPRLVYVPAKCRTQAGAADSDRYFSTTNPQDGSGTPRTIRRIFCANQDTTTDTNPQGIKETSAIVSCNHSIMRSLAAIFQIIFAAKELYDARGTQVERYGYAAYSFTVTPFLLMSFLNLLAMICEPQYPTLYLVELDKPPGSQKEVTEAGDTEEGREARAHDPQRGAPGESSHPVSQENNPEGQSTGQQKAVTQTVGTIFLSMKRRSSCSELLFKTQLVG